MLVNISGKAKEIREFINSPRKRHSLLRCSASWNMLCSCLDSIEDTEMAIETYLAAPEPAEIGDRYLLVYGIMQTLFLQQDAVKNLCEALGIDHSPHEELRKIREIRNNCAGHPTKRGRGAGTAFNFISQISLRKSAFTLLTFHADREDADIADVDLLPLIAEQRQILTHVLLKVIDFLRAEEEDHKAMHRKRSLRKCFPDSLDYHFGKMFDGLCVGNLYPLSSISIAEVTRAIDSFKGRLQERGTLDAYDEVTRILQLLEHPCSELVAFFAHPQESKLDNEGAYIFLSFLQEHVRMLKRVAADIDKEYEAEPSA